MADLGNVGRTSGGNRRIPVDTALARNIRLAPITCWSPYFVDPHKKPRYLDQEREIRGTVRNSSGTGISRRVLAIDARTGAFRGITTSAADGTFKLRVAHSTEPVQVIAVPNAGDARNAVIFDAVVPVAQV